MEKLPDRHEVIRDLNAQFTYLLAWTREIGELDMVGALFAEYRGMQDAGWSTVQTAFEVFEELTAIAPPGAQLSPPAWRQVLGLYAQLAEAGGVYESIQNLLGVIKLKPWNLWPFQDLVRVKSNPARVIGPNANAMFRNLARAANEVGMTRFGELLETAFRDDIRNGICHADYILAQSGLRLRRRNGGQIIELGWPAVARAVNLGQAFFGLLALHLDEAKQSFNPARAIIGRFSANPPMKWRVEYDADGSLSVSSSSVGMETDAGYRRQEHINRLLGGKVMTAYALKDAHGTDVLIEHMEAEGFSVPLVEFGDPSDFAALQAEIAAEGLWRPDARQEQGACQVLLASPSGMTWLEDIAAFHATLPPPLPLAIQ